MIVKNIALYLNNLGEIHCKKSIKMWTKYMSIHFSSGLDLVT